MEITGVQMFRVQMSMGVNSRREISWGANFRGIADDRLENIWGKLAGGRGQIPYNQTLNAHCSRTEFQSSLPTIWLASWSSGLGTYSIQTRYQKYKVRLYNSQIIFMTSYFRSKYLDQCSKNKDNRGSTIFSYSSYFLYFGDE